MKAPNIVGYQESVKPEWIDAYGHLNEAHYAIPFTNAMWPMQDQLQFGLEYTEETGNALYTVEMHIRYLREVRPPASLEIENLVIGLDRKRLLTGHVMRVGNVVRATCERLSLNYNQPNGKVVPFPDDLFEVLSSSVMPEPPDWFGETGFHRNRRGKNGLPVSNAGVAGVR